MVTRFFKPKQRLKKVQDVADIFDPYGNDRPNGGYHTGTSSPEKEDDMVPELISSQRSTPIFSILPSPTPSRQGLLEQLSSSDFNEISPTSLSETPRRSSFKQAPRKSSVENVESMYEPPKYSLNRLLSSCANSNTRNSLNVSGVAAAFYNGGWLPSSGQTAADESITRINEFIAETRAEIDSGLPGRLLTVVIGGPVTNMDSIIATVSYAYFLHTKRGSEDHCYVPVINMKRSDLQVHSEVCWLFKTVALEVDALIFADEISLTYYHRFNNLKLVLVSGDKYDDSLEKLKDTVVEILGTGMSKNSTDRKNNEKVGSCCTLVAETFAAEAPNLLLGRGFGSLLLAGILLNTSNLDPLIGQCSSRDVCMATLLLNGAGRYGCNGFFKMLRRKVSDLSVLSPREILNKDVRLWISRTGSSNKPVTMGLSTMGIPLGRFLSVETAVYEEFTHLRRSKRLDILLVSTSYYDKHDKFNRELLIATESREVIDSMVEFYNAESLQLQPLKIIGIGAAMKAFIQGNISISPTQIQELTDSFVKQC